MDPIRDVDGGVGQSQFAHEGFTILGGYFTPFRIDRAVAAAQRVLEDHAAEVVVDDLLTGARTSWAGTNRREGGQFNVNDLYLWSEEVRELALDSELTVILADLLGEPAALCHSVTDGRSAPQAMQIDSIHLTPRTPHALISVWIALEDSPPEAGAFAYFPGSHRIPLYTFNDGTHHASPEETADWFDYIDVQTRLRGMKERLFLAKKGDVFIGHADLVHSCKPATDSRRTRHSIACHYFSATDCRERGLDLVRQHHGHWIRHVGPPVGPGPVHVGTEFLFPQETYPPSRALGRAALGSAENRSA